MPLCTLTKLPIIIRTVLCSSGTLLFKLTCRERNSGAYGTPAYYIATLLFDMVPMRVIPPVFFAIFTYWLVGLHTQCIFCIFKFIGEPLNMVTGPHALLCPSYACWVSKAVQVSACRWHPAMVGVG